LLFKYLPLLFLCLFAFSAAWWTKEFIWQDDVHVTNNAALAGPSGLVLMWTSPRVTPVWSPLGYTFLWPQHYIWNDRTPLGYHLVNLLLHTFNAMLVWMLAKRLQIVAPFVIALVFAVHPLQTESVGWIARQPQLLGTMFGLWFCLMYWRWSGLDPTIPNPSRVFRMPEGRKKLYVLAIIMYLLALTSAPLYVCTLPLVMGLIVWWKSEEFSFHDWRGLFPFVVLSVVALVVNYIAELARFQQGWGLSKVDTLLLVGRGIGFYVQKFLWPINLTVTHEKWPLGAKDIVGWLTLVVTCVIVIALWVRRRVVGKAPLAAAGAFLLLILPMLTPLNRVEMQTAYVAERFGYLAYAALAAAGIAAISAVGRPIVRDERWPAPIAASLLVIVLTCVVFFGHANSFASNTALWENTVANNEDNTEALVQLARMYEKQKDGLTKAVDIYRRVLRLSGRRNMDALIGLGNIIEKNDLNEAALYYQEAMAALPDRPEPIHQYGPVLVKQKKYDEAIALYQSAMTRFPKDDALYRLLGRVYGAQGKIDLAIDTYKKGIAINPYDSATHVDLATCYFSKKDMKGAIAEIETAAKLDPRNFDMYMTVGEMCALSNDWENAYLYYRIAGFIRPEAAEPSNNVGFVLTRMSIFYWQKGQPQLAKDKLKEALVYFQRAIELKPDFESAKKNLSTAQMIQKQVLSRPPPASQPATGPATKPAK